MALDHSSSLGSIRVSHKLSNAAIMIHPCRLDKDGKELSARLATGFLWVERDVAYLITNWHNLTGWNPIENRALSTNGMVPTHVRFSIAIVKAEAGGAILATRRRVQLPLVDDDGAPTWMEHPRFRRTVDVAAIKIGSVAGFRLVTQPINTFDDFTEFHLTVGDDAYIIGFPMGLTGGGMPIWKRASIATEPNIDIDGLPKLLVDTASREGMSGSPVIAVRRGITIPRGHTEFNEHSFIGTTEMFLGIYSGRVGSDQLGAQLGIVWKSSIVGEIIQDGVLGTRLF